MKKLLYCLLVFGVVILSGCSEEAIHDETSSSVQLEEPCAKDDVLTAWCGFKNPEDLAVTPDNQFLIATGFGGLPDSYVNEIVIIDLATMKKAPAEIVLADNIWGDPSCTRETLELSTHGLDIVQRNDGVSMLAVTNHLPRETIEFFELLPNGGGWQLNWKGCVDSPVLNGGARQPMFNDVALTKSGNFYATEMYNGKVPFEEVVNAGVAKEDSGQVWFWSAANGFGPIPNTEGGFPNGIVVGPGEATLFFNFWFTGETIKFDLETEEVLAKHFGGMADNLTISENSLWTIKHDMTLTEFFDKCGDTINCFLPFSVYELDFEDLKEKNMWNFDSSAFGFGTVATPVAGKVWLGSANGDRVASFELED